MRVEELEVEIGAKALPGDLALPEGARGLVVFAHGSGSSRFSPRNRYVASVLEQGGFATLLIDLLTEEEERIDARTGELRFDVAFLARRLLAAVGWARNEEALSRLPLGAFGASTGAGAALVAAAEQPEWIASIVSRGGRPDLAGEALARVRAPTLLIVGGADHVVLRLNREAMEQMTCRVELEIVPGATHLFEEPGALERVAELARGWFERTLSP